MNTSLKPLSDNWDDKLMRLLPCEANLASVLHGLQAADGMSWGEGGQDTRTVDKQEQVFEHQACVATQVNASVERLRRLQALLSGTAHPHCKDALASVHNLSGIRGICSRRQAPQVQMLLDDDVSGHRQLVFAVEGLLQLLRRLDADDGDRLLVSTALSTGERGKVERPGEQHRLARHAQPARLSKTEHTTSLGHRDKISGVDV